MRRIGFLEGDVHLGAEHEVRVEGSRGGPIFLGQLPL